MHSTSTIVLNSESLKSNIDFIRSSIGPDVRLSSVVKGNAYGHGIEAFVPLVESCGVDHFSVFSADEAHRVHSVVSRDSTILIMGEVGEHGLEWVIENDIEFFVFDIERALAALTIARKLSKPAKIHIEVETGLNRTGFNKPGLKQLVELIKISDGYLVVEGLCTHYAGAESIANYVRVQNQIKKYNKFYQWLVSQGITPTLRHTACSAAAMAYPKTHMDLVRIGILQYGFWPSKEIFIDYLGKIRNKEKTDPLKRVISWTSYIMSIKEVRTGEFIGYGTSYLAQQNMSIAAVPVGYAHGYSRILSNQGRVLVNGRRVGVVGIVNMNMMMIDISDVPDVHKGMKVTLIGGKDETAISVASFGELSNQLNYELLTRLPHDIPRLIK
ncbi:Alanine racemase [Fulvivirga imtechensis AK7]|uniref:Alanine racemase n=1 Tax=Fulvivirga imtechensis AK7 TaxID=1237149 RepID=L8JHM3_9BACT|nr:alanine racemase [Fulvivirga imtechensis]ELR68351.1 Alanine racemase [Fulvivirga imtechensis AK7]